MPIAVTPVSSTSTPWMPPTEPRMSSTTCSVAGSVGPVSGITARRAVRPSGLSCGGVTARTLSVSWTRAATWGTAAAVACGLSPATTIASRPVKPGPKPSLIRSLETRAGEPTGAVPWSGRASRMSEVGSASAPSPSRPTRITGTRNRMASRAQRKPNVVRSSAGAVGSGASVPGSVGVAP